MAPKSFAPRKARLAGFGGVDGPHIVALRKSFHATLLHCGTILAGLVVSTQRVGYVAGRYVTELPPIEKDIQASKKKVNGKIDLNMIALCFFM